MSSNGLRVGVAVLLNNGYSGVIKYVCHDHLQLLFGIELQQPIMVHEFMNGHNGTIGNEELFVPLNCIVTTLDDNGIDSEPRYTLKIKNDTIYFPIISEDEEITQKKPKKDDNEPQRNDIVQLTDGRVCTFLCISRSVQTDALYYGVKLKQKQSGDSKAEMVWICRKDICMDQFSSNELAELQIYVNMCYSDNAHKCLLGVSNIRRLLCVPHHPDHYTCSDKDKTISTVVDSGVVKRLVQFLQSENDVVLQLQALWALANISSGTDAHTRVLVRCGAIPLCVKLLKSATDNVKDLCMHTLSNIAGTSSAYRDMMLLHGILIHLVPLFHIRKSAAFLRTATWTLSNLCRHAPVPKREDIVLMNTALAIMITSDDHDLLHHTLWAFSYLAANPDHEQELIFGMMTNGSLNHIVCLLGHESAHIRHPALRIIGNVITGEDYQTQHLINCGVLKKLRYLMLSDKAPIRREACWTVSNIAVSHLQEVIDAKLVSVLIDIMNTSNREQPEVLKEAIFAIHNAILGGTYEQTQYLVDEQVIPNLIACIFRKIGSNTRSTLLSAILFLLECDCDEWFTMMVECGIVAHLKQLKSQLEQRVNTSTGLYNLTTTIINRYFNKPYDQCEDDIHIFNQKSKPPRTAGNVSFPFQLDEWTILHEAGSGVVRYIGTPQYIVQRNRRLIDGFTRNIERQLKVKIIPFQVNREIFVYLNAEYVGIELDNWSPNARNGTVGNEVVFKTEMGKAYFIETQRVMNTTTLKSRTVKPMIGDRVETQNGLCGVVKYVGNVEFRWSVCPWFGIELDSWNINGNNGIIKSKKYFDTEDGRGYFVQLKHLVENGVGENKVETWLGEMLLLRFYPMFAKHGFVSLDVIRESMTAQSLQDMGIESKNDIFKIMYAIEKLTKSKA
eukprot:647847_1